MDSGLSYQAALVANADAMFPGKTHDWKIEHVNGYSSIYTNYVRELHQESNRQALESGAKTTSEIESEGWGAPPSSGIGPSAGEGWGTEEPWLPAAEASLYRGNTSHTTNLIDDHDFGTSGSAGFSDSQRKGKRKTKDRNRRPQTTEEWGQLPDTRSTPVKKLTRNYDPRWNTGKFCNRPPSRSPESHPSNAGVSSSSNGQALQSADPKAQLKAELSGWETRRGCDAKALKETIAQNVIGPEFFVHPPPQQLEACEQSINHHHSTLRNFLSNKSPMLGEVPDGLIPRNVPRFCRILPSEITSMVVRRACVDWHKPISVSLFFQVSKHLQTTPGDEPTLALLDACAPLHHDWKKIAIKQFLKGNVFIISLRDLRARDSATKRWPKNICKLSPPDSGQSLCATGLGCCMRKPRKYVRALFLRGASWTRFPIQDVWRAIQPFKNLKVLGFDLRRENAHVKETEGGWFEFDAPKFFIKAISDIYKHFHPIDSEPVYDIKDEEDKSEDDYKIVARVYNMRIRIAVDSEDMAQRIMEPDSDAEDSASILARITRVWNWKVVPFTEDEQTIMDFLEQVFDPNGVQRFGDPSVRVKSGPDF
ncbi:MAG: hypothetical protein Q9162_000408 [Coniocarpon cinnabarinum]